MSILAVFKRIFKEMIRDKRTLAMMFIAPLLMLGLMYFLFQSGSDSTADLAVHNVPNEVVKAIDNKQVKIHRVNVNQSAKEVIRQNHYAGYLTTNGDQLVMTYENADQTQAGILKQSIQGGAAKLKIKQLANVTKQQAAALKQAQKQLQTLSAQLPQTNANQSTNSSQTKESSTTIKAPNNYTIKAHYLYANGDASFFVTMLPIFVGFVVFFFVFMISGISLLGERNSGTLSRLLATPIKRSDIIYGYLGGYGLFAILQTIIVVLFCVWALQVQILGSLWLVMALCILIALVALAMGLFISSFAASEFQMMQFIPLLVIPQVFFSGIVPVSSMDNWLQVIAHFMPLYYGASALTDVIQRQATLIDIWEPVTVLIGILIFFVIVNIFSMRKYRKV
ncbi:ABC transporter permease [Lentilactobacillus senioris]|uniref:ABC transporter permease n=1 Tax=Lentilactobacillus senioris TaxID=931534 RepID=UPI00228240D7|nr:ABC transporter permease [Lentilactobacillus senioris]MCY9806190.1 ABC transporter permease [Lentilactobacillus senioris]